MYRLVNVEKKYVVGSIETTALNGVNVEIKKGEYVSVTGPSGCGKSTLLSMLGLLDIPTSGKLEFDGHDVSLNNEGQLARIRAGRVGFVFQSFNLIPQLTVRENIELPLRYSKRSKHGGSNRVKDMLDRLGLGHRANHLPVYLSGGQQQRVAVARALATDPEVLLADEPTGNLDSSHGAEVMRLIAMAHESGTTVILVTHSLDQAREAKRIITMRDGAIVNDALTAYEVASAS